MKLVGYGVANQLLNRKSEIHPFSNEDFKKVIDKFAVLTGVRIQSHKKAMVHARVQARLVQTNCTNIDDYLSLVSGSSIESTEFCNSLTTNLTSFFREQHHFDHFEEELLNGVKSGCCSFKFWSAGCSTGEEPYSMALVAERLKRDKHHFDVKILATDIDTDVLETAKLGSFTKEQVACVSNRFDFGFSSISANSFSIKSNIANMIAFKRLNLIEEWPIRSHFDGIFCRNVLIYFPEETKTTIIGKLCERLKPGGVLYLGHSETIFSGKHDLISEGKTVYRKSK